MKRTTPHRCSRSWTTPKAWSPEDVAELTDSLPPGDSAAILVFEHTWALPLRQAVVASGGVLAASLRIPGAVVDEVLATVPDQP
jgi:hypothetical protein